MSCIRNRVSLLLASSALCLLSSTNFVSAQSAKMAPPAPMSRLHYEKLKAEDPQLLQTLTHSRMTAVRAPAKRPDGSVWQPLTNQPSFGAMCPLLLTDGTVLVGNVNGSSDGGTGTSWFKLTPDITGSYVNGTWTKLADMQAGYEPLYVASAILPDGRVIVEGGEYNNGNGVWSGQGSIYDPVANTWTPVQPPAGIGQTNSIGDANGIVLDNGMFMLSPVYTPASGTQQLFNPSNLSWTATGKNNQITNDEASQSLLQNGRILSTASYDNSSKHTQAQLYNSKTGNWNRTSAPAVQLWDVNSEIGPQVTMLNGAIFAFGSTLGHTATYQGSTWTSGPDMPVVDSQQYGMADAPATILPSGHILAMGGPGYAMIPAHFFVYDGTSFTQTDDTPNAVNDSNFQGNMLLLPTGQVLLTDQSGDVEIYTDPAAPAAGAAPTNVTMPKNVVLGTTYTFRGNQLGGVTQGSAYGDDYQSATNYPILRITNNATQHVFYARTFGFSQMTVTPNALSGASFTLPTDIEAGASQIVVVASGFASAPAAINIRR